MSTIDLLSAGTIGEVTTANRVAMAPMTRSRAGAGGVPGAIAAEYYGQRASAGLIVTEGTGSSAMGMGYARTPGIFNGAQIAGWRAVTDTVHGKGGRIFLQLMHVGRISHSANRTIAEAPVAPSAIRAAGQMWTDAQGMQPFDIPRALETGEVAGVIEEFAQATRNALAAGFDGVELHAASGYLPMQFLSSGSNHRTDRYGGSVANRVRFVVEALEAMTAAAGLASKVGIKISPAMQFNDIQDDDPTETYSELARAIAPLGLAYLHVMRSPGLPGIVESLRALYPGTLMAGAGFDFESGNQALAAGAADFIAFGRFYISNPDLVERFQAGAPLAEPDQGTFYTPGAKGYTDYPRYSR